MTCTLTGNVLWVDTNAKAALATSAGAAFALIGGGLLFATGPGLWLNGIQRHKYEPYACQTCVPSSRSMAGVTTRAKEYQKQWDEVTSDPTLDGLPYKVETNAQGQIILSPHTNRHSDLQAALFRLLQQHAPEGHISVEYALATPRGVKAPDVVWMSPERRAEMRKTGDPSTQAPEVCVEVMSTSNTEEEMREKRALYLEIGAEEVWVIGEDGAIRFFEEEEVERSKIAPECPKIVQLS